VEGRGRRKGLGLLQFVKVYGNTRAKLRVLFILARHPRARLDRRAFSFCPEGHPLDLAEGLEELVALGVLEEHSHSGEALYSLRPAKREPVQREPVQELAGLDLGHADILARLASSPRLIQVAA
jgi:hypothetical protein